MGAGGQWNEHHAGLYPFAAAYSRLHSLALTLIIILRPDTDYDPNQMPLMPLTLSLNHAWV